MKIHRLILPDVLFTREVNALLINENPVTLIDTGPKTKEALDTLICKLKEIGLAIEDIKRVFVTHSHSDHSGLLQEIRRLSGAVALAGKGIKNWIEDYDAEWNKELLKIMHLLDAYKVPRAYISGVVMMTRRYKKLAAACKVDQTLEAGDIIEFDDFELEVISSPGHSGWCLSLFELREKVLFCGDLLIENLTSHPLMQPTPEDLASWPNQIEMICRSLDTVCALEPKVAYRGHGEPVVSAIALKEKILQIHETKQKKILQVLERGPKTLFEINLSANIFKNLVEQFIEMFETLHHLNCLLNKGLIEQKDSLFSLH